eukprot:3472052-Prymnesium_polylepis.1
MVRVQSGTDTQAADERSAASRVSRWRCESFARDPQRSTCRKPGWMGSEEKCRFGAQSSCAPSQRC